MGKRNGGRKKLLYFIATTHKGQGTDDRDDDMQKKMKIFSMQKNDATTKIHFWTNFCADIIKIDYNYILKSSFFVTRGKYVNYTKANL